MPKSVLIVEDNELNMKLFNDFSESRGYRVIQTRNGMEALDHRAGAHCPISFSWTSSSPKFPASWSRNGSRTTSSLPIFR